MGLDVGGSEQHVSEASLGELVDAVCEAVVPQVGKVVASEDASKLVEDHVVHGEAERRAGHRVFGEHSDKRVELVPGSRLVSVEELEALENLLVGGNVLPRVHGAAAHLPAKCDVVGQTVLASAGNVEADEVKGCGASVDERVAHRVDNERVKLLRTVHSGSEHQLAHVHRAVGEHFVAEKHVEKLELLVELAGLGVVRKDVVAHKRVAHAEPGGRKLVVDARIDVLVETQLLVLAGGQRDAPRSGQGAALRRRWP